MKKSGHGLLLLAISTLSLSGCAYMFEHSPAGVEVRSMGEACLDMKKRGLLPGVAAGEESHGTLSSEQIAFSKRDDVSYPFRLKCIIVQDDHEYTFPFIKQSSNSEWKLSQ
ncbi:MAG: hypothetical protein GY934_08100 [Gammaproteobacteria bacterium]|nr:hypothetical protein [Gammaproteobacteria bacterium]